MWIFTNTGFLSAVEHRDDKTKVMVRGRRRNDLLSLSDYLKAEILETPIADYRWRLVTTKEQLGCFLSSQALNIGYDNFKNSINNDDFHDACSDVWSIMYQYQNLEQ